MHCNSLFFQCSPKFWKEEETRARSASLVPAGRCRAAPAADCAAPGRASASGGEAACLCSPGLRPAPARPAGTPRTPAAPPHSPHPGQRGTHSHSQAHRFCNIHIIYWWGLMRIWTGGPTSVCGGSSASNWERILRVSRRIWERKRWNWRFKCKRIHIILQMFRPCRHTLEMLEEWLACSIW